MENQQNLLADEAVQKLREIIDSSSTCLFGTRLDSVPMRVCPMQVQQIDGEGALWLFSGADSDHNRHLTEDPRAHLIFTNVSKSEYLTYFGEVEILRDRAKAEELWNPLLKAWFEDGPSDANLTLLRVLPKRVHYWDTEDGKLVSMAKVIYSAFSDEHLDAGVQGDLRP